MVAAWEAVVTAGIDPLQQSFLEAALPRLSELNANSSDASVHCDGDAIEVRGDTATLVVLRQPYDPGWALQTSTGGSLSLVPANAFHSAFIAPAGGGVFRLRFVPKGLTLSRTLAASAWLAILAGLALSWRRRSSERSARKSQE
jgi:uncharacterized membrane protein YfhO